jgi:hypothetical protein
VKAIIGNLLYDTETAEELGSDSWGYASDFHHWQEALYRTRGGAYFTGGSGGPLSRYARTTGQNEWSGGEKIIPLTEAEAREWMERHCAADEYEAAFGAPEEA